MSIGVRRVFLVTLALALGSAALLVTWRFEADMRRARAHAARGSVLLAPHCGPIEYQEAGAGVPLLAVHGSGGTGAPSALQTAIRHPDRVRALVLLVPLTYEPPTQADSAPPMPPWVEASMMRLIRSDFLFWSALHVARDQVIKGVLATPPELLVHAGPRERARVEAMLENILPVSLRAEGLRSDTAVGKHLLPSPLESIRLPTLVISARDDRYGTFASAKYTADRIPGARFIGFEEGGYTWVGHDDEVLAAIAGLLLPPARS